MYLDKQIEYEDMGDVAFVGGRGSLILYYKVLEHLREMEYRRVNGQELVKTFIMITLLREFQGTDIGIDR